jgi:NNP family nitrate/nitrite transporter-like MFS transporter
MISLLWTSVLCFCSCCEHRPVWMHVSIQQMERGGWPGAETPQLLEFQNHKPAHVGALRERYYGRRPRTRSSGIRRVAPSRGAISGSIPRCCYCGLAGMVGRRTSCHRSDSTLRLISCSGSHCRAYSEQCCIFYFHGADLRWPPWTTLATWSLMIPVVGIGYAVQKPVVFHLPRLALLCGFGGGNFCIVDTTSRLLPRSER